jgi:transposase
LNVSVGDAEETGVLKRCQMRSDSCPYRVLQQKGLPGKASSRVKFFDAEKGRSFVFLTNQFMLPAHTIAELYRYRWRVEIFFKWIKQHLRIKSFYGTSQNAVKTQIWIAISTYVLVAIMKKRLTDRFDSLHNFTDFEHYSF